MKMPPYIRSAWYAAILAVLTSVCMPHGADARVEDVDLDIVGASAVTRPLGPNDRVPPSHFLGEARTVFDHAVGVSGFQQLGAFREVYPGIDMACYGDEHHFEFSFILRVGADPSLIRLRLNDVKTEGISSQGHIVYTGDDFEAYEHTPVVFHHAKDGTQGFPGRLVLGQVGESSVAMASFFDEKRDEFNETRFSIVTAGGGQFGPDYDFFMSKYETTNEQLIRFLNDAEANNGNPRGENMFFDEDGNVWINPEMAPGRDEMFQIDMTKIEYDPLRVAGDRYHHVMDDSGREPFADHPATGISWFGAVKYCNWLTLQSGRGPSELCYTEGTNTLDWAPITATNWVNGFFSATEREEWLKLKGFRLPMFRMRDADEAYADAFNEFVKAGSWMGHTNVAYGFGRNTHTNNDANVLGLSLLANTDTLPVGYFNGLNPVLDGRTRHSENYYGIYDLSGNVSEWVNDPARAGTPDARSACGGSYGDQIQPIASDRIVPPHACESLGGFRPVTSFMPEEYTQVNILYCFHRPGGVPEELRERFGDHFETLRAEAEAAPELGAPGEGEAPGEDDEAADEGLPARLTDDAETDEDGTGPRPPGIIYKDDDGADEGEGAGGTDEPDEGGDGGPGPSPPTPPLPPVVTFTLGVYSENPDSGVTVAVSATDINGNGGGSTGFERNYLPSRQVSVTAPSSVGDRTFKWWLRNGIPFSTANTITLQMLSDVDITAVYEDPPPLILRTLTVDSPNGNVPIDISLTDVNDDRNGTTRFERIYDHGKTVTATAPPDFGGEPFRQWLRNGVPFSNSSSVTVTMLSDMKLTATYGPAIIADDRILHVTSSNPDSGVDITVSVPDNRGRTDGSTTFERIYTKGGSTTLTAPATVGDKTFSHWLRNDVRISNDPAVNVTLLTDTIMTAVYVDPPDDIILTVRTDPHDGVPISIGTPDKDGAGDGTTDFVRRYDRGATTTVTAPSDIDGGTLLFKNWVMNGIPLSTNTSINISLLADTELVAVYREAPAPLDTYDLTVQSRDPDSGVAITVSTPDINTQTDGSTTFTRTYEEGTETILTAPEVAPNGYTFEYWEVDGVRYSNNRTINIAMYGDTP